MKALIFDSSSIINLVMSGIEELLASLKTEFNGKFIMTESVKYETMDRPMQIKRFELGALKVKNLLDNKIFEFPNSIGISNEEIKEKTKEILNFANSSFSAKNEFMHIIDLGEASCLALSLILNNEKIKNAIVVDERTTRMLVENPANLKKLFENKLHTKVSLTNKLNLQNIKIIRSSELAYLAYKKNLVELKNGRVLDALLYATKFNGSSISRNEIEEMKRL